MKHEKFCFNKKVGIFSLIGIVFVFLVLVSQSLTKTQTSTNSRAEAPQTNKLAVKKPYPTCSASSQLWYGSFIDCAVKPDKNKSCADSGFVADNTFNEVRCLDEYYGTTETRFYKYFKNLPLESRKGWDGKAKKDEVQRGTIPCVASNKTGICFLSDDLKLGWSGWVPKDPKYKDYIIDMGSDGNNIGCPVLVKKVADNFKTVELGYCYVDRYSIL